MFKVTFVLLFFFSTAMATPKATLSSLRETFEAGARANDPNLDWEKLLQVGRTWQCYIHCERCGSVLRSHRNYKFKIVSSGIVNEGVDPVRLFDSIGNDWVGRLGPGGKAALSVMRVDLQKGDLIVQDPMGYTLCSASETYEEDRLLGDSKSGACGYSGNRFAKGDSRKPSIRGPETIAERIYDCGNTTVQAKKRESFSLVAKDPYGFKVWRDDRTRMIWSDYLPMVRDSRSVSSNPSNEIIRKMGIFSYISDGFNTESSSVEKIDPNLCRRSFAIGTSHAGIGVNQVSWDVPSRKELRAALDNGLASVQPGLNTHSTWTRDHDYSSWWGKYFYDVYFPEDDDFDDVSMSSYSGHGVLCRGFVIE